MKRLRSTYVWAVYAFLYLPILVAMVFSFNKAKYAVDWRGFTWKWYKKLFANQALLDAAINTLTVSTLAATLATILGTVGALTLYRYRFAGRKLLHGSIFVLTISPDIVMGISLLIFFVALNIELGFTTLLVSHITLCLPFVVVTVLARLSEFDENIVEAAKDLGASEARALRYVVLPLIMPAVAAGWLLAFTLSMDDVLISFFVTGPKFEILPLKIYSMVRLGVKPHVNALTAVMFTLTVVLVFAAHCISKVRRK